MYGLSLLLMDAHHDLKNRYLHVGYKSLADGKSATVKIQKGKNCTLDCTLEEGVKDGK
jgi:hypothetical protein